MLIQATKIKRGMIIRYENELYTVMDTNHVAPGNWRAMVFVKIRKLKTGSTSEQRLAADDRIEQVMTEQKEAEFLFNAGNKYTFMYTSDYEQIEFEKELIEDAIPYLLPNMQVLVNFIDNQITGIAMPTSVELEVKETDPSLKSATVTNVFKPATLETGLVVQVPPFIEPGEKIRVDTRTGEYLERVGKK